MHMWLSDDTVRFGPMRNLRVGFYVSWIMEPLCLETSPGWILLDSEGDLNLLGTLCIQ